MRYPCNCKDMRWMIDHNKVFKNEDGIWVLSWMELNKNKDGTINTPQYGVKFNYCMFCGKGIGK